MLLLGAALLLQQQAAAQTIQEEKDSLVVFNNQVKLVLHQRTGTVSYRFATGVVLENTVACLQDLSFGTVVSAGLQQHSYKLEHAKDGYGKGIHLVITHEDAQQPLRLLQHITIYEQQPFLLTYLEVENKDPQGKQPETRHISPVAILPATGGRFYMPGNNPRILDIPFDNDNWVRVLEQPWPADAAKPAAGISYEFSAVYDNTLLSGFVAGSVTHDFWKTGIAYRTGTTTGSIDSLLIYGGAATPDNAALPPARGGLDGTHDHVPHGTMSDASVISPLIYLAAVTDIRKAFVQYGDVNVKLAGRLSWKAPAPFYWNSFGVEGVLGYSGVMMPPGVIKTSEFIQTLDNFNKYGKPVLSVDSYDRGIYNTGLLTSLSRFAAKKNQQMGFYFIPFATWAWKSSLDNKLEGTDYTAKELILKDNNRQPMTYKDGDWAAFPLDPTHPGTRQHIINELQKAKAIHASFIKIDFLTAGALESDSRYDRSVRSGMQAYTAGMKMLKGLIDSIVGPDVFITMAISPMFPHQYAHTRFLSTDVYSHLRDDQPGFPSWGSTQASLSAGSHLWWMQGTLWPYTNLDVAVMKNFQKNPDLTEQEVKVRLYAMMVMGSILGDGSDFRNKLAADRARLYLNNPQLCAFFSDPKVFTPLKFSDGESFDQQLSFYLKGDTALLGLFNFHKEQAWDATLDRVTLGLENRKYVIRDFLTDAVLGNIEKEQAAFRLTVNSKDALLVKLVPVNE